MQNKYVRTPREQQQYFPQNNLYHTKNELYVRGLVEVVSSCCEFCNGNISKSRSKWEHAIVNLILFIVNANSANEFTKLKMTNVPFIRM